MPKTLLAKRIAASAVVAAFATAAQAQLAPVIYPAAPQYGPQQAAGAVVWLHGRSLAVEDSTAPTPPYIETLHRAGWDAFRFNRRTADDNLADSTRRLVGLVDRLQDAGYRQIALAGQSFGGFLALGAAAQSRKVDAVIATAPAAFGDFATSYDSWRLNALRLYPLLERIQRAKVMLFFFHGDDYDPGGRGDRATQILANRPLTYDVIDQPRALTTHWVAGTLAFAERCGQLIADFLNGNRRAQSADLRCRDDYPPVETPSRPLGQSSFVIPASRR